MKKNFDQSTLLSLGEVDLPLLDVENGNEEEDCAKKTKLLFPGCCVLFAEAEEVGLFEKLDEHLFGFEVDGRLDKIGNGSVTFNLFSIPVFPMIEVRAAANAEWKFGSDVIALVAAAIVSGGKED